MKFFAVAMTALTLLLLFIFFQHDLRGWTPADYRKPSSIVEPIRPDGRGFVVGDCLPGTIAPWTTPRFGEYSGSATVTVLTCRSRSSALKFLLAYLVVLTLIFAALRWRRARRTRAG